MELSQLRTTGATVLIHVPLRHVSTITVGGKQLYFDPSWHKQQTKRLRGVVVACPALLGPEYLLSRPGSSSTIVPVSAIQDELRVGDVVYTDWAVGEDHHQLLKSMIELPEIGEVYRCRVNNLLARVCEGRLEPYGSYVFLREVWPDDVEAVEVLGQTLRLRVSKSGLTLGSEAIPPVPYQGIVAHVGRPLRGQPGRVQVGDRVVVDKKMCGADKRPLKLTLEGEEYLCIRQDYIAAVLEEKREVTPGYTYDLELITRVQQEFRVEPDIARFVEAHKETLMHSVRSAIVERVAMLGGITPNQMEEGVQVAADQIGFLVKGKQYWLSKADWEAQLAHRLKMQQELRPRQSSN